MAKKTATTAPRVIGELVDKFAEHCDAYHRPGYNETQLRQDFLDPFFEALGWDVYNRHGFAEAYREVILEQSLRVEKSVRIGGTRKYFVEAKKSAVDIRADASLALYLHR